MQKREKCGFIVEGYRDCIDFMQRDSKLSCAVNDAIKDADKNGFSYSEIYTGLHKVIELCMYEYEVEKSI